MSAHTPPQGSICAVSVVIPMYNAEKYIAATLDSLLVQTLQDFEVIVINDCSTDNCRVVAENYLEKFGGRLKIYDNEKNSGASTSRNNGLLKSNGEYVFFMDSDDLILPTALEEMYTHAKDYDAEVVYCEAFFKTDDSDKNRVSHTAQGSRHVTKPTFEPENMEDRIKYILRRNFWGVPWVKLIRRELLIENDLFFPVGVGTCEDHIWTYGLFIFAKKFLRIPNAVYVWRMSSGSTLRSKRTPGQRFTLWLSGAIFGEKFLDKTMSNIDFFDQNPQYRYAILEHFALHMFRLSFKHGLKLSQHSLYEAVKNEFGDKLGEYDVLIALLCSIVNKYQKIEVTKNERIAELESKINA